MLVHSCMPSIDRDFRLKVGEKGGHLSHRKRPSCGHEGVPVLGDQGRSHRC